MDVQRSKASALQSGKILMLDWHMLHIHIVIPRSNGKTIAQKNTLKRNRNKNRTLRNAHVTHRNVKTKIGMRSRRNKWKMNNKMSNLRPSINNPFRGKLSNTHNQKQRLVEGI